MRAGKEAPRGTKEAATARTQAAVQAAPKGGAKQPGVSAGGYGTGHAGASAKTEKPKAPKGGSHK